MYKLTDFFRQLAVKNVDNIHNSLIIHPNIHKIMNICVKYVNIFSK